MKHEAELEMAFPSLFLQWSGIKIQVTSTMKALLKQVLSHTKGKNYLLVGPSKVGKTTTLVWLYKKLKCKSVKVLAILPKHMMQNFENVSIDSYQVVLMDFGGIQDEFGSNFCHMLSSISQHSTIVIASSSLNPCLGIFGHRQASKAYTTIATKFQSIVLQPLDHDNALDLSKHIVSGLSELEYEQIVAASCHIPGLLSVASEHPHDTNSAIELLMKDTWSLLGEAINKQGRQKENMVLLISAENNLPVKLSCYKCSQLVISCHVVYIDKGGIVHSYYPDLSELKRLLKYDIQVTQVAGGVSDQKSAVGFCFEYAVLNSLLKLDVDVLHKGQSLPTSVSFFHKAISPTRYRIPGTADSTSSMHNIQENILYLLEKDAGGIDLFSVVESGSEKFLLLIQVTVRAGDHRDKLNASILKLPPKLFAQLSIFKKLPSKAVFLFISPKLLKFSLSEGFEIVSACIPKRHWINQTYSLQLSFGIASGTYRLKLLTCLDRLEMNMDPTLCMINWN